MSWNIAPECVSSVILSIIWVYSRKGNPTPSLQNKLFQACFFTTLSAMLANIISTFLIYTLAPATILLTWFTNTIYFIMTPLMGLVYFYYSASYLLGDLKKYRNLMIAASVPAVIYLGMVLINPLNQCLFGLSLKEGYFQGPLIMATYVIFYLYCLLCCVMVVARGKQVQPAIRLILFFFPLIAGVVIVVQLYAPNIILSGSAATCALLLIYLFLQNKQISIDYLTGVPNRQELLKMLEIKLKHQTPMVLMVLSLKEFRMVNNTYGQSNGDRLLVQVCRFLERAFGLQERQIYRFSGDEFAILLDGDQHDRVLGILEGVLQRLCWPWILPDCQCVLDGALGVVSYPGSAQRIEELIDGLEYAIVQAKSMQTGYCYCDAQVLERAKRRQRIAMLVRDYFQQDRFEVFLQPIWSTEECRFQTAEALLRMRDTPLGEISPGEFVPIAEESGLIVDITYQVLEKVCTHIRALLDSGVELESVNVNFSAHQFSQKDLVPRIQEILGRTNVPAEKLKIEITESTLAENQDAVYNFASEMHAMNVRVGLDDFGTGYSNLSSVISLPLDVVKLDKSLVWSAMENPRVCVVVRNLTRAFGELNMTVLAEGVETLEQSQFVESCGCSLIQGFYYAKPMPVSEFEQFMKAQPVPAATTAVI